MSFKDLLGNVIDVLTGRDDRREEENVAPASQDPYGDPADQAGYSGTAAPASQDPYGDPADGPAARDVLPASQDPYGDPADQDVQPASQDPYGDPADEEEQPVPAGRRGGWPF